MKSVFINYSWKYHKKQAHKIYSVISKMEGFKPWMDDEDLIPGLKWKPAIYKAINESQIFISLLSRASLKQRGEKDGEIRAAIKIIEGRPTGEFFLIPALLNKCEPPHKKLQERQWIRFFPEWQAAEKHLINTLRNADREKDIPKSSSTVSKGYHYKVGVVDIDVGIDHFSKLLTQLNNVQSFFQFGMPAMQPFSRVYDHDYSPTQFSVDKIPSTYIKKNKNAGTNLFVFLTHFPLKFNEKETNYLTGPHPLDKRFLFVSTNKLKTYCREAKCSFEEGLVFLIAGQLVAYFSTIGFHDETKYCVMDFCEDLSDVVFGLIRRNFCNDCYAKLPDNALKTSIQQLLSWRYQTAKH